MRVLQIINDLGAGGAEKLIDECVSIMNKYEEIEVEILLLRNNNIFGDKLKKSNTKIHNILSNNLYNPINIILICKQIINGHYDIVHSHLFPANYWAAAASMLIIKNKPIFITTEHNTHNKRRNIFWFRIIEKLIYSSYDKIISISKSTQNSLLEWLDPKPGNLDKFVVVENGINLSDFRNASPYLKPEIDNNFNEMTKILCMVGSLTKQKDQSTIVKSLCNLPSTANLILVGDGTNKKHLEELSAKLGVRGRVKFLGIREDVPRLMKTADIIIVSSNWEGFGLVAAEGMAAGKPVIASNVPGLNEVVGDAGVLFEKGNAYELAKNIKMLLENKGAYKDVKKKCLLKAANYDVNNMVEKYLDIYKRTIHEHKKKRC